MFCRQLSNWCLSLSSSLCPRETLISRSKWSSSYRWSVISATSRTQTRHLALLSTTTVTYFVAALLAEKQIHEDLISSMYSSYVIESLSALSLVFIVSLAWLQEEDSTFHWMILEIFMLLFCNYSPQIIYQSALQTNKSNSSQPSLRVSLWLFFDVAFPRFAFGRRKCSKASSSKHGRCWYRPVQNDRQKHANLDRHLETLVDLPAQKSE